MSDEKRRLRRLAKRTAPFMFAVSLIFLVNTAALLVFWVDVPRVREAYLEALAPSRGTALAEPALSTPAAAAGIEGHALQLGSASLILAGVLWPIFFVEALVYRSRGALGAARSQMGLLACICPPLRLAAPNPALAGQIWLPRYGWRRVDDMLRERLEKAFGLPMILIALMILPILLVELTLQEQMAEHLWLRILLHVSTGTIWFAFALEFIVMWSVAERKLQYCREHWLDLAIILLPLISFLRSLRLVRATRLARLAKVQQLTKIGRMYRLRGLAIKGLRALLLFEVLNRVVGITPEKQLRGLREKLRYKEREVESLRRRIEDLERLIAVQAQQLRSGPAGEGETGEGETERDDRQAGNPPGESPG